MNKLFFACLAAVLGLAVCEQPACAWINSQFGIGMNWNYASGGNSFLCGAFRNGQPGGPERIKSCTAVPAYPVAQPCAPSAAPYFGAAPMPVSAPAVDAQVNTQSLRYPTYPGYRYPVQHHRGY